MMAMRTDHLTFFSLVFFILMGHIWVACGDPDDPAAETSESSQQSQSNDTSSDSETGSEDSSDLITTSTDVSASTDVTDSCDPNRTSCPENKDFTGQIGGTDLHHGGTPSASNYDNDAGISAVLDAMPDTPDEEATGLDLKITEATVSAVVTFRDDIQFFIQDKNAAVMFFLDAAPTGGIVPVTVGQKVSVTVRAIKNYFDTAEITQASDWQLVSSGNPVYIQDKTGEDLSIGMLGQIVRMTGGISANNGSCGGSSMCYTFTHGNRTIILRSASEFIEVGDCYTYVGPVSQFSGAPQLDSVDFDWIWEDECGFNPDGEETGGETSEQSEDSGVVSSETTEKTGGSEACPDNQSFNGQIGGTDPHQGGTPSSSNYASNSGISAVLDAMPDTPDEEATGLNLKITEATVTAVVTFRDDKQFFIQDKSAAVMFFLNAAPTGGIVPVTVGQKISVTVQAVKNYFGTAEITQATGWQLVSSGNPVYIQHKTGEEISIQSLGQIVRVSGEITQNNGACGGSSKCYTLKHGDRTITLRSSSDFLEVGDCITFVGPVSQFDDAPQLDTVDFDWIFENFPE